MHYIINSLKNIEEACQSLEQSIEESEFGLLHRYDMQETMAKKSVTLNEACRIYELCNPHLAKEVLEIDMSANMLLPCRISVYTEDGLTKIGMMTPSGLMKSSLKADTLAAPALAVEKKLQSIIDASA